MADEIRTPGALGAIANCNLADRLNQARREAEGAMMRPPELPDEPKRQNRVAQIAWVLLFALVAVNAALAIFHG